MKLSKYIDHTLLKASAVEADIIQLCNEAIKYDFYAVCVNSCYVGLCVEQLKNTAIKTAAVVGFPLGAMETHSKIFEAKNAINAGADEIDMVINIGFLKDKKYSEVATEMKAIKNVIGDKILKVIIETCYLSDEEKKIATQLVVDAGADYVKTSTGFGNGGANITDIQLMKAITQDKIKIKASGGIRDYETAIQYIENGVMRIGTSNGIQIVTNNSDSNSTTY